MSSIRLHPKHGVNPTILMCFFCGKERNELALLGNSYKGEAPMHMCLDYEPCDRCKEHWARGIVLIEADSQPMHPSQPALIEGAYPTGRWCVITEAAIDRVLNDSDLAEKVKRARRSLVEREVFSKMIEGMPESQP